MDRREKQQALQLASRAGELMLRYGAEIFRVEDTITRLCHACGVSGVHVFALPTGLFLSIDGDEEDGEIRNAIRRIYHPEMDLRKIAEINDFSRRFAAQKMSIEEGLAELERIAAGRRYSIPVQLLGAGIATGMFGLIYSANPLTALFTCVLGILTQGLFFLLGKLDLNYFIKIIASAAFATAMGMLGARVGLTETVHATIISVMFLFTPGSSLTNSIRDLLYGDMLSGLIRFSEACLTAISLVSGAIIALQLPFSSGRLVQATPADLPLFALLPMGAVAIIGIAFLLNTPKRALPLAMLTGGVGWASLELCTGEGLGLVLSVFISAFLIGGLARASSKIMKLPMTIFIILGITPLLPGGLAYFTMQGLVEGGLNAGADLALRTFASAGAIALGLLAVGSALRIVHQIDHRLLRPNAKKPTP